MHSLIENGWKTLGSRFFCVRFDSNGTARRTWEFPISFVYKYQMCIVNMLGVSLEISGRRQANVCACVCVGANTHNLVGETQLNANEGDKSCAPCWRLCLPPSPHPPCPLCTLRSLLLCGVVDSAQVAHVRRVCVCVCANASEARLGWGRVSKTNKQTTQIVGDKIRTRVAHRGRGRRGCNASGSFPRAAPIPLNPALRPPSMTLWGNCARHTVWQCTAAPACVSMCVRVRVFIMYCNT